MLFILYINGIVQIKTDESTVKLFADDTIVYVNGYSAEEIETKLNSALQKLEGWLNINKLKMNASKTKYMILRSVRKELSREIVVSRRYRAGVSDYNEPRL